MSLQEIAKVRHTTLGYEDHGIFTAWIHFDMKGGGQGFGGHVLRGEWGMQYLQRILSACGVDSWEKLPGRTVFVLRKTTLGPIIGIEPLPTEPGETFLVDDLNDLLVHS
jgi:hypothetical protein